MTGILVRLPAPRLRETFASLPRCDLGVVLIDAASTLTPDDLDVLRLLYEAGSPPQGPGWRGLGPGAPTAEEAAQSLRQNP